MLNVKVKETFAVNPKTNETICILTVKDAWKYETLLNSLNFLETFINGGLKKTSYHVTTEFRGVSKCHEQDEFNAKEGRRIARERAYEKLSAWNEKFSLKLSLGLMNCQMEIDGILKDFAMEFPSNMCFNFEPECEFCSECCEDEETEDNND